MFRTSENRIRKSGFAELLIGYVAVAAATALLISQLAVHYSTATLQRDRLFASAAAEAIKSEILALPPGSGASMDGLDDGEESVPTLSITERDGVLVPPDHELSGNYRQDGRWVWSRHIAVDPLPGPDDRELRNVTIRVFKTDPGGAERELASMSTVVGTPLGASRLPDRGTERGTRRR